MPIFVADAVLSSCEAPNFFRFWPNGLRTGNPTTALGGLIEFHTLRDGVKKSALRKS